MVENNIVRSILWIALGTVGVSVFSSWVFPPDSHAIPAFARKYTLNCNVCYTRPPRLNTRKSEQAIHCAQARVHRTAARQGRQVKPSTLEYAKYVILFTTFPESGFTVQEVLQWYRIRWQVELVFKRFKSLAQLGHRPKYDDGSAKAWLYGKLLVALLVEKLIGHAESIAPWGYGLEEYSATQGVA